MSRYRRYSGRRSNAPSAAIQHIAERRHLSAELGGVDEDVLQIFFRFPPDLLERLMLRYESQHGEKAASYAREAFPRWRSGVTKISGQNAKRLLNFVPEFLSRAEQYDILTKLYERHRSSRTRSLRLEIGGDNAAAIQQINAFVAEVCAAPQLQTLPCTVRNQLEWACNRDASVARQIMAAFETGESMRIADAGRREINTLLESVAKIEGRVTITGHKSVVFPHGVLTVSISNRKNPLGCAALFMIILLVLTKSGMIFLH